MTSKISTGDVAAAAPDDDFDMIPNQIKGKISHAIRKILIDHPADQTKQFRNDMTSAISVRNLFINERPYPMASSKEVAMGNLMHWVAINADSIRATMKKQLGDGAETNPTYLNFPTSLYQIFHQSAFSVVQDKINRDINLVEGNDQEVESIWKNFTKFFGAKSEKQAEMPKFFVRQLTHCYFINYVVMEKFELMLDAQFEIKSASPDADGAEHIVKTVTATGMYDFKKQKIKWNIAEVLRTPDIPSGSGGVSEKDADK